MPKTYTIQTYQYSELDAKAKKVALDYLHKSQHEMDHSIELLDLFSNRLAERHYPFDDIRFSLSSRQGDGVAFYGAVEHVGLLAKAVLGDDAFEKIHAVIESGDLSIRIKPNRHANHYSHYNCMDVSIEYSGPGELMPNADELEKAILADVKELSKELEVAGYNFLDSMLTDEYLIEEAEAVEVEFTKAGKFAQLSRLDAVAVE